LPVSDLDLLTGAARAAGDIARRHWRQDPAVITKPDGSPVSAADLEVDAFLRDTLCAARPDYGWLSEETADDGSRHRAAQTFIVDPIDGTRAFLNGETTFSHALAVVRDGLVTAAVVFLPMQDQLYAAAPDGPATLNGTPIRAADRAGTDGATLLTAKANFAPEHWKGGTPPPVTRAFRASMAYRLCLVADGSFDAALTLRPAWDWDIAAGALICERAGARVSDRHGAGVRFNTPGAKSDGLIAAGGAVWRGLAEGLA
jgi:myo-inositol-1(or 4)-monophosphatase